MSDENLISSEEQRNLIKGYPELQISDLQPWFDAIIKIHRQSMEMRKELSWSLLMFKTGVITTGHPIIVGTEDTVPSARYYGEFENISFHTHVCYPCTYSCASGVDILIAVNDHISFGFRYSIVVDANCLWIYEFSESFRNKWKNRLAKEEPGYKPGDVPYESHIMIFNDIATLLFDDKISIQQYIIAMEYHGIKVRNVKYK